MTTDERSLSNVVPAGRPRRWAQVRRRIPHVLRAPFYWLYQRRLERDMVTWNLPRHIGVIMDGNRRYARELGFSSVSSGHLSGAEKLWEVLSWCYEVGVPVVTVWSFSLDNFERDTSEVEALLGLFEEKTKELAEHEEVHQKEVRVRYLGEIDRLPDGLRGAIRDAEA
jgi:undecaprenyl pyrophosphate synthase